MATPEGKVKARIKRVLDAQTGIYYFMPVQNGFGVATLDYVGWHHGLPFAIEAKADGKVPTPRQEATIEKMVAAGARVFVIDGSTDALEEWLRT
jgi:hypothetical protein